MTSEKIAEKVKKIVAENLSVAESDISNTSNFITDLGADSLDTMELVMSFESAFGCQINDDQAEKIQTVQDAIDYIEKHIETTQNS